MSSEAHHPIFDPIWSSKMANWKILRFSLIGFPYIYVHINRSILYIYVHKLYIYIYIYREREREKERKKERLVWGFPS